MINTEALNKLLAEKADSLPLIETLNALGATDIIIAQVGVLEDPTFDIESAITTAIPDAKIKRIFAYRLSVTHEDQKYTTEVKVDMERSTVTREEIFLANIVIAVNEQSRICALRCPQLPNGIYFHL